ncbi:ester cyclase [Microbacterium sp. ZW T5_45]|uniref:ester cyclase n=1 Tax=Microbacterium sp. ZW T5_45 TaxID=3378080 RepID=UPI0038550843
MESWELRGWFEEYLDALNRHDPDAVRELLAPDVRRAHRPAGADAWIDDLADLLHGFPDFQWKRIQLIVEDDRIAAHLRGSGTHTGPFHGIAPTRRRVNIAEFAMIRVVNGRIVESSGTDDDALLRAIGA